MPIRIETKALTGFVLTLLAFGAVSWSSYGSLSGLAESAGGRNRAHRLVVGFKELRSLLLEAETAERGFVLSGDEAYLESFDALARSVSAALVHAGSLVADSADQGRLQAIGTLASRRLVELREVIAVRKNAGLGAALERVRTARSQGTMASLQGLIGRFEAAQQATVTRWDAEVHSDLRKTLLSFLGSMVLALMLLSCVWFLFQRDVATRRRAHEELRQHAERLNDLYNNAPCGYHSVDKDGTFVEINDTELEWLGYQRHELIGKLKVADVVPPASLERARAYMRTLQEQGVVRDVEVELVRKDGTLLPVLASATAVRDAAGNYVMSRASLYDITDRRRAEELIHRKNEELLEQSRRAQEATRAKSEFLANMSHELRTPLNAIIGFAELMHDGKLGPVSRDHKEFLGDILTSARHLLQLINDVLDLAKVESGKMEFRPAAVDLRKLVAEVIDILRTLAAGKRIRVETEIAAGLTATVDPSRLKQVLYNYVSNALKFTPSEGRVCVRVAGEGEAAFRIEVEDTGSGIAPGDLPRLFGEFEQIEAGRHEGTGLGLALTKRIVEAQGGHVGVRSTLGEGSVFFAVLPRVVVPEVGGPPVAAGAAASEGEPTLLVVEDDPRDRDWLVRTLHEAGFLVTTAASGAEAAEICRKRRFGAIVLDMLLPDISGWETLRALRTQGPNSSTPVVVASVVGDKRGGAGFAIQDFLVKPIRTEDLLAALEAAGVRSGPGRKL